MQHVQPVFGPVLKGGDEERRFIAIAGVDEALGDRRFPCDLVDRNGVESMLKEQPHRGIEQGAVPTCRLPAGRPAAGTALEFSRFEPIGGSGGRRFLGKFLIGHEAKTRVDLRQTMA